MSITCINEDETIHDFTTIYEKFLSGEVGHYDGSFNAREQFNNYLASLQGLKPKHSSKG